MILATYIAFSLGVSLHVLAALFALAYLQGRTVPRRLTLARYTLLAGAGMLTLMLALRVVTYRLVPLTTPTDSLSLFVIFCSITAFILSYQQKRLALLVFYLPPVALLAAFATTNALDDLGHKPEALSGFWLTPHVGLVFFSFSLFFIASLTSLAYAYQARRLKNNQITGLFQKLPSLENLDRTLYQLIRLGYPAFVLTLLLGLVWAWRNEELTHTWWFSPKVIFSIFMVIFYAVCYHARARGFMRGPKLAYFVFIGFGMLLGVYLLLEVMHLFNYNFTGAA